MSARSRAKPPAHPSCRRFDDAQAPPCFLVPLDRNKNGRRPGPKRCRRRLDFPSPGELDYQQDQKIDAHRPIADQRLHSMRVDPARQHLKAWMRVPFAEVVEPRIVMTGSLKEFLQMSSVFSWVTNETGRGPARVLNGNLRNPENLVAEMLPHEQPADFAASRAAKLTLKLFYYLACQYQLHLFFLASVQ